MGIAQDTKNKISDALKEYWSTRKNDDAAINEGAGSTPKTPEAQKLFSDYTRNKETLANLARQRDAVLAQRKSLSRKKASRSERAKINAQIKQITAQLKEQRKKQAETIRQANIMRQQAKIKAIVAKAEQKKLQADSFVKKSQSLLKATKDTERSKRLAQYNAQVEKFRARQDKIIAKANERLVTATNNYFKPKNSNSGAFNFVENFECLTLSDKQFVPFRKLTEQEKRVNFTMLAEEMTAGEAALQAELVAILTGSIEQFAQNTENKLTAGDIAAIAGMYLLVRGAVRTLIKTTIKKSFESGKSSAVSEINKYLTSKGFSGTTGGVVVQYSKPEEKIEMPATSLKQNSISNLDTEVTTEQLVSSIENVGKKSVLQGVAVGAATAAIVSNTVKQMRKKADEVSKIVAGSIVAKNINRGRNEVFKNNIAKFSAFQRSEILDGKTCPLCIALDGKVISPDDPMRETEQFHTYCRGIWVSVFVDEPIQPEITGIPTAIKNNFDLIDGRAITNSIRQPKLPKL